MKFLFTTVLSVLFCLLTYATAQYPDKIIFSGKEYGGKLPQKEYG